MNRRRLSAIIASVASVAIGAMRSRAASAQATPFVAPGGRVYRDIDRLAAAGLIDTLLIGARPFSEREIARLLGEASRNLSRNPAARSWAEPIVTSDLSRFGRRSNRLVDAVAVEEVHLDSPYRLAPKDSNGGVDAFINPLAAYRGGRALANGQTEALETLQSVALGQFVALAINPRATIQTPRGFGTTSDLRLQSGFVNVLLGNVSIEAGRDYVVFGQSPTGGLLLSDNAPALDMVRVSNDAPFVLPWLLRVFGPVRGALFVSDPGERQLHPHAKLIGYHMAILPQPRLELGLEVLDAMGGNGGQPASFGDRILDAIPIVDVFRAGSDFQFSNKMAAADAHWRVPSWRGFELYAQTAIDDFDARRLKSVFLEDGGYLVGTSLSCIAECGRFGIRAEYHQTGIRFYTHPDYPIEQGGVLLGDPLGPRGLGGYLTLDGEPGSERVGRVSLAGAFEVRSGDGYTATGVGQHGVGFHFVQVFHGPGEKRARVLASWAPELDGGRFGLRLTSGAERVTNYGFVIGADRTNWMAGASLVVRP